jgi:hypothetical protein
LNVAAVVRWLQGKGFRACYDAGLKAEPAMAGRVKLSVRISSDGSVRSAHGEGITGMSDAVVQCLMGKVRHAQFAPPGEMGSTLTIPLTFSQHTAPR